MTNQQPQNPANYSFEKVETSPIVPDPVGSAIAEAEPVKTEGSCPVVVLGGQQIKLRSKVSGSATAALMKLSYDVSQASKEHQTASAAGVVDVGSVDVLMTFGGDVEGIARRFVHPDSLVLFNAGWEGVDQNGVDVPESMLFTAADLYSALVEALSFYTEQSTPKA